MEGGDIPLSCRALDVCFPGELSDAVVRWAGPGSTEWGLKDGGVLELDGGTSCE